MTEIFDPTFFIANRQRLRTLFTGTAPIVITAHGLLQRSADTTYPFRQDSNFWYLTGITEPDVVLVMDKQKEYLIVPGRSDSREAFDGSLDHRQLGARAGIETVLDDKTGWKQLTSRLSKSQHVATLSASPSYIDAYGMYTNPARRKLIHRMKASNKSIDLLDLRQHFVQMRMIKQPQELVAIQAAIDATIGAFTDAKEALGQPIHEYDIDAVMTAHLRHAGSNHAYSPIIAAGANACTLHYLDNAAAVHDGELVLLDVGGEVEGYAADISRTYAVSQPTKRQSQVWAAVVAVQDYAFSLLKPGVNLHDYEKQIEQFMGEKLRELGLIKIIEHEAVRHYYPHATSHYLGLDVHDAADYERVLEPGMVLTVEPGIYIPEESIGIRIEDDIVVTKTGVRNLSKALAREL